MDAPQMLLYGVLGAVVGSFIGGLISYFAARAVLRRWSRKSR